MININEKKITLNDLTELKTTDELIDKYNLIHIKTGEDYDGIILTYLDEFVGIIQYNLTTSYIVALEIDVNYRNNGFATYLIQQAIKNNILNLTVNKNNENAIKLYEKIGFIKAVEEDKYYIMVYNSIPENITYELNSVLDYSLSLENLICEININSNDNDTYIEICEMSEEDLAGRIRIKMSSHLIHPKEGQWNKNGITWLEQYTQDNIKSAIGMNYVVSWADEENQIPSGHGEMSFDDEGNVQFDGIVVGSVQDAYITDIEIDNEIKKVMMTEGYINSQRYPLFVKWLREEIKNGKVHGSIEINGKGKSKNIIYLDGNKNPDGSLKMGRCPIVFDFSGLAILSNLENPADDNSIVFEVNSKQEDLDINNKTTRKEEDILDDENNNMKLISKGKTIELNNLTSWEIETLLEKAFRIAIGDIFESEEHGYYVDKLYPINAEFIIRKWSRNEVSSFYKSSYSIDENNNVTLGDIYEVEENWTPVNNEKPIEMNNITKEENNKMDEKIVLELNQKIEDKINEINTLTKSLEQKDLEINSLTKSLEEKATEINSLTEKVKESDDKVAELNTTIVEVNKLLESEKTEKESLIVEVNSFREEKVKAETEAKIAEVNSYFETEITKNGFEESEVNSLKSFVDAVDLEGLKRAEAELCAKKFKELVAKDASVEVNTKNDMFIAIKEKEMKKVSGSIPSFFN